VVEDDPHVARHGVDGEGWREGGRKETYRHIQGRREGGREGERTEAAGDDRAEGVVEGDPHVERHGVDGVKGRVVKPGVVEDEGEVPLEGGRKEGREGGRGGLVRGVGFLGGQK